MNTAFGTLVRNRCRSLYLSQARLAQRMASWGQGGVKGGRIDLPQATSSIPWLPLRGSHSASWRSPVTKKTGRLAEPVSSCWSDAAEPLDYRDPEQFIVIQEEPAALHDLDTTLQQYVDDLEARVQTLLASISSRTRPLRFDD